MLGSSCKKFSPPFDVSRVIIGFNCNVNVTLGNVCCSKSFLKNSPSENFTKYQASNWNFDAPDFDELINSIEGTRLNKNSQKCRLSFSIEFELKTALIALCFYKKIYLETLSYENARFA